MYFINIYNVHSIKLIFTFIGKHDCIHVCICVYICMYVYVQIVTERERFKICLIDHSNYQFRTILPSTANKTTYYQRSFI